VWWLGPLKHGYTSPRMPDIDSASNTTLSKEGC
jgi:hypothetical protein